MAKQAVAASAERLEDAECNVISFDEWRQRRMQICCGPTLAIGSQLGGRGDLRVRIDDGGHVDYGVENVEVGDAPAMLMACMILCMRLVTQIDEERAL